MCAIAELNLVLILRLQSAELAQVDSGAHKRRIDFLLSPIYVYINFIQQTSPKSQYISNLSVINLDVEDNCLIKLWNIHKKTHFI